MADEGPAPQAAKPAASSRQVGGRDLPTAIAVGVGLGALFLGSLFAGPVWFALVITALIVPALWEASEQFAGVGLKVNPYAMMVGAAATIWLTYQDRARGQAAGVAIIFALAVMSQLLDREREDILRRLAVTVFMPVWVGLLASYAVMLRGTTDGEVMALAVIGGAIFGDIGGFAFGVKFGKTKIAPKVSPNKSLEGLIGGMFVAGALAAFVLPQASDLFTIPTAIVVGVLGAFGGFVGDLVESMIKRDMGIKDFGTLIPGHGGVLDRVDGILLSLPLGWFAVQTLVLRS